MNYEEFHKKKSSELSKVKEDLARSYKSKTPVPKNLPKQTLKKNHPKRGIQKSNSPRKDQLKITKHNSNDFKDLSNELIKRTKNKGSRSVEIFNNIQDLKKNAVHRSILHACNLSKAKVPKKLEKAEFRSKCLKFNKPCEKSRKKSSSPSELHQKDRKPHKDLINIQNLLNNFTKKKKNRNKNKKLQDELIIPHDPSPNPPNLHLRPKKNLSLYIDNEDNIDPLQNIKIDSWLANNQSKISDSLEILSDIQQNHIVDESEVVAKNFSFIHTDKLKDSLQNDLRAEMLNRKYSKSFDSSEKNAEFIVYESDLETYPVTLGKIPDSARGRVIQRQSSIEILPKKRKIFSVVRSALNISPQQKNKLSLDPQSQLSVLSHISTLQLETFHGFSNPPNTSLQTFTSHCSIKPSSHSNTQILIDQISEELTNNINNLFILEQLRDLENLANSVLYTLVPVELQQTLKRLTESKFSTLLNFLQPRIEYRVSQFLSILNPTETSLFLQKGQKKKEIIKELLSDLPSLQMLLTPYSKPESSSDPSDEDDQLSLGSYSPNLHSSPEPLLDFGLKPVECETDLSQVLNTQMLLSYSKKVLSSLNSEQILQALEAPLAKDPLEELDKIQDLQIGTFTDQIIRDYEKLFDYSTVLEIDLCSSSSEHKDQQMQKIEKSFKNMVLDAINFFLQQFRPFGFKGKPFPWEMVKQFDGKIGCFEEVYDKVLSDLEAISAFEIGKWEDGYVGPDEKMVRARVTEGQINRALQLEIIEEEERWVDYGFEEVQVKIDLADVVLYELVLEVININN